MHVVPNENVGLHVRREAERLTLLVIDPPLFDARVMKRVEYLLDHAALTKAVREYVWEEVASTYVLNREVREEMRRHNPWALYRIVEVLYEAHKRGYWSPGEQLLDELEKVRLEVEQLLE